MESNTQTEVPIYSPFRAAQRKYIHKKEVTYAFGASFLGLGIGGYAMTRKPLYAVVGASSGLGLIASQRFVRNYPEWAFASAIGFSTVVTMTMFPEYRIHNAMAGRVGLALGALSIAYHLSQI